MAFRERIDVYAVVKYKVEMFGTSKHYQFSSIQSIHLTPQTAREEADKLNKDYNDSNYEFQIEDVELKR